MSQRPVVIVDKLNSRTYTLIQLLGSGSFGDVFSATERTASDRRGQTVVLKQFVKGKNEDQRDFVFEYTKEFLIGQFLLESDLACHLQAVCAMRLFATQPGLVYLVFPFTGSTSLHRFLPMYSQAVRLKQRTIREMQIVALDIAERLLNAIAQVHAIGVIHQDIKPRNIVVKLDSNDFLKLTDLRLIDFGFACTEAADKYAAAVAADRMHLSCATPGEPTEFFYKTTMSFQDPLSLIDPASKRRRRNFKIFNKTDFEAAFRKFDIYAAAVTIQLLIDSEQWERVEFGYRIEIRQAAWLDASDTALFRLLSEMTGPLAARRAALQYSVEFEKLRNRLRV